MTSLSSSSSSSSLSSLPLDIVFVILSYDDRFCDHLNTNQRLKRESFWRQQSDIWFGPLRFVLKLSPERQHMVEKARPQNQNGQVLFPRKDYSPYLRRLIYDEYEYETEDQTIATVSMLTLYLTYKYFNLHLNQLVVEVLYYQKEL